MIRSIVTLLKNTTIHHHTDHLSGSNIDTDETGKVVEMADYYPFGALRLDHTTTAYRNPYKFTGKEPDTDTGLYYYSARYYDPEIGHFISQDQWGGDLKDPQSLNRYSYVLNNPLKYIDPTGLFNINTGGLEEEDTKDDIVQQVNDAFGISTDWKSIADVSFRDPSESINEILNSDKPYLNVGKNKTTDITYLLNFLNKSNAETVEEKKMSKLQFALLFMPRGPMDYKNSSDKILGGGEKNRKYFSYIFNGELIRYDAPGNIHYGYVGRANGYSLKTLLNSAALAQWLHDVGKFKNTTTKDNKGDSYYIMYGYFSYTNKTKKK